MTEIQLAHALQFAAVLLVGLPVVFWMIPIIRLDTLRQNFFVLRGELFDFASGENIAFHDPAYQLLRGQMNALIRYAHHLTLFRALLTLGMRKATGDENRMDWNLAWDEALSHIKREDVRVEMKQFHDRAMKIMLIHLVTGSPLLLGAMSVAMVCVGAASLAAGGFVGIRQLVKMASGKVLQGPLDLRLLEEAALYEPA